MRHPPTRLREANVLHRPPTAGKLLRWAPTGEDIRLQDEQAAGVEGKRLIVVRYINIDYAREDHAPGVIGPHLIQSGNEWAEPTWQTPQCDSVDFGLELHFPDSAMLSLTWESPGPMIEGLRLVNGRSR